jgi:hypothetical protein
MKRWNVLTPYSSVFSSVCLIDVAGQLLICLLKNVVSTSSLLRLCSFDISDMYTNVPQGKVIDIIKTLMTTEETDSIIVKKTIPVVELLLQHNYFQLNSFYKCMDWQWDTYISYFL